MVQSNPVVSIGLPVRNGEDRLTEVVESVLAQDYEDLELVISDNASTDGTEQLCRRLARADRRIVYHRQLANIGLFGNFNATVRLARGTYFRWIGDDDSLQPSYLSRCLEAYHEDPARVLVTTQMAFVGSDGAAQTAAYTGHALSSSDPAVRFSELLRLLNESYLLIDPLYGLMRRATLASIARRNMYCEDQVLAARLALAGPWAHVREVLALRRREPERRTQVARKIDVPVWQVGLATMLMCRELLRHVNASDLEEQQRRLARAAIARFYVRRHQRVAVRRGRRMTRYARALVAPKS